MNINLINYLISNNGILKEEEDWYTLGIKFNIEPPDLDRAKNDEVYKKKAISTKTNDIWRNYLKQKEKLELRKQVYEHGKLRFETFGKTPDPEKLPVDEKEYELERITTNPGGGAWLKYKKITPIKEVEDSFNRLKEILLREITPLNYQPTINTNNLGLFIYTSDKHIGALTKDNSIYNNDYNREEIKYRLIFSTIRNIEKSVKYFGSFENLFLLDLGDALDGFNQKTTGGIRGTSPHVLPQQMNNREQHDFYVEVHKELFDYIMSHNYAKHVNFIATSNSNHGGDFEYGAMRNLETYLNVRYPDIKTYINCKPLNHFTYGNHAIIFGHGKDDEDMKNGLPLNLNEKIEVLINDYINVNNLHKFNVTVVTGDLHQSSENYGKNFRYKKVLSQFGSSKWSHTNFGSGSPGLSFEIFDKFTSTIFKVDDFFFNPHESNTGITL